MATPTLSPIDVAQRQFKHAWHGYAPREVDAFLQDVSQAMTQLVQHGHQLQAELSVQKKTLEALSERENDVKEALVTAQQAVEQVRLGADKQAKLTLQSAQVQASKIVADAEARLGSLSAQVGELSRQRVRFIEELRGMVATHARMLELYTTAAPPSAGPVGKAPTPPLLEVLEAPVPPSFLDAAPRANRAPRRHEARLARHKE